MNVHFQRINAIREDHELVLCTLFACRGVAEVIKGMRLIYDHHCSARAPKDPWEQEEEGVEGACKVCT